MKRASICMKSNLDKESGMRTTYVEGLLSARKLISMKDVAFTWHAPNRRGILYTLTLKALGFLFCFRTGEGVFPPPP